MGPLEGFSCNSCSHGKAIKAMWGCSPGQESTDSNKTILSSTLQKFHFFAHWRDFPSIHIPEFWNIYIPLSLDLCEDEELRSLLLELKHKHDLIMKSQQKNKSSLSRRSSSTGSHGWVRKIMTTIHLILRLYFCTGEFGGSAARRALQWDTGRLLMKKTFFFFIYNGYPHLQVSTCASETAVTLYGSLFLHMVNFRAVVHG